MTEHTTARQRRISHEVNYWQGLRDVGLRRWLRLRRDDLRSRLRRRDRREDDAGDADLPF